MSKTIDTAATANTAAITDAVKTLLGLDKAALAEVTKNNPDLAESIDQIKNQIAEEGSPRNVAAVNGLEGDLNCLGKWMHVEKGASTYVGTESKIADRSVAVRMVMPAKKAADAETLNKVRLLTLKATLFMAAEAKKMGLTAI